MNSYDSMRIARIPSSFSLFFLRLKAKTSFNSCGRVRRTVSVDDLIVSKLINFSGTLSVSKEHFCKITQFVMNINSSEEHALHVFITFPH